MVVPESRPIEPTDPPLSEAPIMYAAGAHVALSLVGVVVTMTATEFDLREQLLIPFLLAGIIVYAGFAVAGMVVAGKRCVARALERWRRRTLSMPEFPPRATGLVGR